MEKSKEICTTDLADFCSRERALLIDHKDRELIKANTIIFMKSPLV
jgi:hypothetical protein